MKHRKIEYRVVHNPECVCVFEDEKGLHATFQIEADVDGRGWQWLAGYDTEEEANDAISDIDAML